MTMLVPTFIIRAADPFVKKEFVVFVLDSGKYSLDYFLQKKK